MKMEKLILVENQQYQFISLHVDPALVETIEIWQLVQVALDVCGTGVVTTTLHSFAYRVFNFYYEPKTEQYAERLPLIREAFEVVRQQLLTV